MESSVQKTRKVLEYLLHKFYDGADGYPHARLNIRDKGMIKAALSTPLRNCDVGTAEEQTKRYDVYCYDHRNMENCCGDCPLKQAAVCEIAFGQLPYEAEEGAKNEH